MAILGSCMDLNFFVGIGIFCGQDFLVDPTLFKADLAQIKKNQSKNCGNLQRWRPMARLGSCMDLNFWWELKFFVARIFWWIQLFLR